MEEYPLFTQNGLLLPYEFKTFFYPNIDEETKAKILQLHDPAEDFKKLDGRTAKKLIKKRPILRHYKEAKSDKINKIFRIIDSNRLQICNFPALYSDTESGLYNNISRINHSCVPNTTWTWVMGDFKRRQVRAIMDIEEGEEITVCYRNEMEFFYGSRESRQQQMLEHKSFLCQCSECSLEGEELEKRDRMRAELREKKEEVFQLITPGVSDSEETKKEAVKKALFSAKKRTKRVLKLNLRAMIMSEMLLAYELAKRAESMDLSTWESDPEVFKQAALKYAKIFGDDYLHFYNINTVTPLGF